VGAKKTENSRRRMLDDRLKKDRKGRNDPASDADRTLKMPLEEQFEKGTCLAAKSRIRGIDPNQSITVRKDRGRQA